jgi:hypothetical protein
MIKNCEWKEYCCSNLNNKYYLFIDKFDSNRIFTYLICKKCFNIMADTHSYNVYIISEELYKSYKVLL